MCVELVERLDCQLKDLFPFLFLQCQIILILPLQPKMLFYILLASLSYFVYTVTNRIISLRRNISLVKSWGLPYVVLRELPLRNSMNGFAHPVQLSMKSG